MIDGITLERRREESPAIPDGELATPDGKPDDGGVVGNEHLTALTGAALLLGIAVVGITILRIGSLLTVHMFVGALLVGPLCLKVGSASYRLGSYYSGRSTYTRLGKPALPFRLLAPALVLSTLALFGSGGLMLILGPSSRGTLVPIHKICFFVWIAFAALHVLGHLPKVARILRTEASRPVRAASRHRSRRFLALFIAVALGLLLAVLLLPNMSRIDHSAHREIAAASTR